ncbi:MAG: pyridoxamine 5'-phosphate oxidase family protein [Burkholderiaceae bacterium]
MLTHRHGNGMLHAHPLTTQNKKMDEGSTLYFFIPKSSELARALAADGNINVSYADPSDDSYVSISGNGVVTEDRAKIEQLWNKIAEAWFDGPNDPNLGLLKVNIHHAEYWDVNDSQMVQLLKMAKGAITGERPKMGEHKELRM